MIFDVPVPLHVGFFARVPLVLLNTGNKKV